LGIHVAERMVDVGDLPDPLVEVGGADGEGVVVEERRDAHRRLAAVREPIESNARGIDKWLRGQPIERALVLSENKGEQRQLERMRLAEQHAKLFLADIWVLRRVDHKAAIGKPRGIAPIDIGGPLILGVDEVFRPALQSVLRYDDWTALA